MESLSLKGSADMGGGEFSDITIEGMGKCSGHITARSITIDGVFKCRGRLDVGSLTCGGVATIEADIKADTVDVTGNLTLTDESSLEANTITCSGFIKVGGEISADTVSVSGVISAREIVGDSIEICSSGASAMSQVSRKNSNANFIEATNVELENVHAHTVNGDYVIIRPGCYIENLYCSGKLFVDLKAEVQNITGEHERIGKLDIVKPIPTVSIKSLEDNPLL